MREEGREEFIGPMFTVLQEELRVRVHACVSICVDCVCVCVFVCVCYRVPQAQLSLTHPGEAGSEQVSVSGKDCPHRSDPVVWSHPLLLDRTDKTDITNRVQSTHQGGKRAHHGFCESTSSPIEACTIWTKYLH